MDFSILGMAESELSFLAVEVAIDLDNRIRGKISELELEKVEKFKEWFLAAEEIYGKDENFYSGHFDPGATVALNNLLADFFQQPKCQRLSELGERIRASIELFTYSSGNEMKKLKDFCLKVSQMFFKLGIQNHHSLCCLAA